MRTRPGLALAACLLALAAAAQAHHSYAMFDVSGTRTVAGTVAKFDWKNPHAFLWVYVPSAAKPGTYDLWGFENGSPSVLQGHGWTKEMLKAGDKVSVEYWPLRDGSIGGHCEKVTVQQGPVLQCPSDLGRR
ncbi:MAG TPA: DUF6152 family protein [Gammaproteobacteria bacterium]|nr:DUF6152 family protein [Gammaproteobacteria bacterium]